LRVAVLADIHSNLHALETVLDVVDDLGADAIVCLGDIIGYAAHPKACLEIMRERAACAVGGNHDFGAIGRMDLSYFNSDARDAVEWTKDELSEEELKFLEELPLTAEFEGMFLVHSTPYFPEQFAYIQTIYDAELAFGELEQRIAFVGHSHVPLVFVNGDGIDYFQIAAFEVPPERRMIINVGSVGQPRDLDSRASFAIIDTATNEVSMERVEYDVEAAAESIIEAGLPKMNAYRLSRGR